MTAGRCAKAPAGAGLNGGPVRPYLPGGIQKGRPSFFLVFHVLETSARPRNRLCLACQAWSRFPASLAGCEGRHFAFRPTSSRGGRDDGRTNGLRCRPGQIGHVEAVMQARDPIEMPLEREACFSCCQVEGRNFCSCSYYLRNGMHRLP